MIIPLSLSANPGVTQASPFAVLPMSYQNWPAAVACLMNFTFDGVGNTLPGAPPTPAVGTVTLQVSNDPDVNSQVAATAAAARWNNHDVLVNCTTDLNSSIVYACRYVRLLGVVTSGIVKCFIGIPDTTSPAQ